jgi:hypothetical protein
MLKMNVRRWRYSFIDNSGHLKGETIRAASKVHARKIIKDRCDYKRPLIDSTGKPMKSCHDYQVGKTKCTG